MCLYRSVVLLLCHENSLFKTLRALQTRHGFEAGVSSVKPPEIFFPLQETEEALLGSAQNALYLYKDLLLKCL